MKRVLAIAFLLASTGSVHAQDARVLFDQGVENLRAERYPEAEAAFLESQRLEPRAATLCNLAVCYEQWGEHDAQAADAYERCAAADDDGRFREHATRRAQEIRDAIALRQEARPDHTPNPFIEGQQNGPETVVVPDDGVPIQDSGAPPRNPPRGHGLLGAGIVALVAGGGLLAGGGVVAGKARDDEDWLDDRYPGDDPVVLPRGSEAAQRLDDAERRRNIALGLYVAGSAVAVVGGILVILDLTAGGLETPVYVAPTRAGAVLGAQGRF